MYQRFYALEEGAASLHLTTWPAADQEWDCDRSAIDQMTVILDATRALRSRLRIGGSARLRRLSLRAGSPAAAELVAEIAEPLRLAARADEVAIGTGAEHESGVPGVLVGIEP